MPPTGAAGKFCSVLQQLVAAGIAVLCLVIPGGFKGTYIVAPVLVLLVALAHIALLLGFGRALCPCIVRHGGTRTRTRTRTRDSESGPVAAGLPMQQLDLPTATAVPIPILPAGASIPTATVVPVAIPILADQHH